MEAKNFRIGNVVIDAEDRADESIYLIVKTESTHFTEWNSGDKYNCTVSELNDKNSFYNIKPFGVRLTKDWLRKFGCKQGYWYISLPKLKAELHFEFYPDEIVTSLKSQFSDLILEPLDYVHELQNLFFALEKRELELKTEVSA